MDFDDDHVFQAIERVIEKAREGSTATYSEVFAAAGLAAPQELHASEPTEVTRFMKAFHDACIELGYPPLDAMVVHASGPRRGVPGPGYFAVNGWADPVGERASPVQAARASSLWLEEQAACRMFAVGR